MRHLSIHSLGTQQDTNSNSDWMSYSISNASTKDDNHNNIYFEKFGKTSASQIKQFMERTYKSEAKARLQSYF